MAKNPEWLRYALQDEDDTEHLATLVEESEVISEDEIEEIVRYLNKGGKSGKRRT